MGGGTPRWNERALQLEGPSPRGRGNQRKWPGGTLLDGTIPAWAGEPLACQGTPHRQWDHPRVGGGTASALYRTMNLMGPSPRGRGNRAPVRGMRSPLRTIPAWAGEPFPSLTHRRRPPDHPRVGGGTSEGRIGGVASPGPSPRGRGNRRRATPRGCRVGTIPAWAGEPDSLRCGMLCAADHPRVGGGTGVPVVARSPPYGPSPRGRGNLIVPL